MPKRRANGEGNIRKRKDGRWEGRYTVGHNPETGKAIIKSVLSKTQAEVKEKLKKAIEENTGIDYGRAKTYTVGSWLEVWLQGEAASIHVQDLARLPQEPHQAADWQHSVGGIDLSGLTTILQALAGWRAGRPHRSEKEAERTGTEDRAEYPSDDRLGIQPRYRAEAGKQESDTGLCTAKG